MDLSQRQINKGVREVRDWSVPSLEVRSDSADGLLHVRGEASVCDSPYEVHDAYGTFTETIRAGAFDRTVREGPDVVLLTNHTGLALARTTSKGKVGSLRLGANPNLSFEAWMNPERSDAKDVALAVKDGTAPQASFAFRVINDAWNEDYTDRTITEVSLKNGDVSICNFGANPAAYAAMRSLGVTVNEFDDAVMAVRKGTADKGQMALVTRAYGSIGAALQASKPKVPQSIQRDMAKLYAIGANIPNLRLKTTIMEPVVAGEDTWHNMTVPETPAVEAAEDAAAQQDYGSCAMCGQALPADRIGGGIGAGGGMQGLSASDQALLKRLLFQISGISVSTGDPSVNSPVSDLTTPMLPVDALMGDVHTNPAINSASSDVNVTGAGHADFYKSDIIPTNHGNPTPTGIPNVQAVDYLNPTVQPEDGHTNGGLYKTDIFTDAGPTGTAAPFTPPGELDYLNPTVVPTNGPSDAGPYKTDIIPGQTGAKLPNGPQGPYKTDIKP